MNFIAPRASMRQTRDASRRLWPGFLVASLVAVSAQFLSDHYGSPAMLMALLLGIAFNFLSGDGRCAEGIVFASRSVLRLGVALLGLRISINLLIGLGAEVIGLVVAAVVATIAFGAVASRVAGKHWYLGLLTGGAVGICGASAAMAISAVLPKSEDSERNLICTVLAVTVLSTVAMLAYPVVAELLKLDDRMAGVFIGATIHDVAQVVGAGFSISAEAGEAATLVKLIRVMMLAPVVLAFTLAMRFAGRLHASEGTAIVPGFVVAFGVLAALNSFHFVPEGVSRLGIDASRWALLAAIAAVGMRTSPGRVFDIGRKIIFLIVAETIFLGMVVLAMLLFLRA
jgi:uncharacterized integral membrane protein (TIGR00698 family)